MAITSANNKINKLIWGIFIFLVALAALKILGDLLHLNLIDNNWHTALFYAASLILLVLHSFQTLFPARALFFIMAASGVGLIMEILGLKFGVPFGGHYAYNPIQASILNVPLSIPLFWSVFIYTGYSIVNSYLKWLNIRKPNLRENNLKLLPLLIIADSLIVVAIDLFMDPLQVRMSNWAWLEGGPYFGVPIGNFIGWLMVAALVSAIFRTYEYCFPKENNHLDPSLYLILVSGYGLFAISFAFIAVNFKMFSLAVLGLSIMLPTVIINLVLYKNYFRNKHRS